MCVCHGTANDCPNKKGVATHSCIVIFKNSFHLYLYYLLLLSFSNSLKVLSCGEGYGCVGGVWVWGVWVCGGYGSGSAVRSREEATIHAIEMFRSGRKQIWPDLYSNSGHTG